MQVSRRQLLHIFTGAAAMTILGTGISSAKSKAGNQMKYKGVVYDVGLRFVEGNPPSVEPFNAELARYDMQTIANDLYANSVRVEGEEIERLVTTSRLAHEAGLTVFFNPWKMNVSVDELPEYFHQAARAAESLRKEGIEIIFVCGCEISLFNSGIFPGNSVNERISWMISQAQKTNSSDPEALFSDEFKKLNKLLKEISGKVRSEFGGLITYASGSWESVDWSCFEITGVDYYRNGETAEKYVEGIKRYRTEKPFVVMEVGSCTYEGAAEKGGAGFMVLEGQNPDGSGKFAGGVTPVRSEQEQADYVGEQLNLLYNAGVEGVFIFIFSFPAYRLGEGDKDLDMVSYSLVKTFPDSDPRSTQLPPWAPKKAFNRVASFFKTH